MMGTLNYHHLHIFFTVVREGGLVPAAKKLRLKHPTLSIQLKRLESQLACQLLERRGRKLELTEMGRLVYRYAEDIFAIGTELSRTLASTAPAMPTQRLAVGIADSIPKLLVGELLQPVIAHAPATRIACSNGKTEDLVRALALHQLDVVIGDTPLTAPGPVQCFHHLIGQSSLSVFAAHRVAKQLKGVGPTRFAERHWLLPSAGSTMRRLIDMWFASHQLIPHVVAESDDSAILKAFAANGMGLVFAPTVIAEEIVRTYHLVHIATLHELKERYFAISTERKLLHPAVRDMRASARAELFSA